MKHDPIVLVDQHTPNVFLTPQGPVYDKVLANIQEIKARGCDVDKPRNLAKSVTVE